ncbi:MAG: hypothetical protein KC561_16305, partial [Myxococcales bacterium]|nr:hypothetical protein [Myxococcales bacterium]
FCEPTPDYCLNDRTISSQAGLEQLATCGPDVEANLTFDGLNDLSAISGLRSVTGYIILKNCGTLSSFNGFEHLETVTGNFNVQASCPFSSLNGLGSLVSVGSTFTLGSGTAPTNFQALTSIENIGTLSIPTNGPFTNFTGLENLESLALSNFPKSITSMDGLNNLTYLNANLRFGSTDSDCSSYNPNNVDISALTNVEYLGGLSFCGQFNFNQGQLKFLPSLVTLGSLSQSSDNNGLTNALNFSSWLASVKTIEGNLQLSFQPVAGMDLLTSSIETIGGQLYISGQSISDMSNFGALTSIGTSMRLQGNSNLTSYNGLSNLESIGLNNPQGTSNAINVYNLNTPTPTKCGMTSLTTVFGTVYYYPDVTTDAATYYGGLPLPACN